MAFETALTRLLHIEHPIIQAPMAGGPTTPELIAAVSNAGGLGSLGAALLSPQAIRAAIRAVRGLTGRPFNVNLFVPPFNSTGNPRAVPPPPVATFRAELGLPAVPTALPPLPQYADQFPVLLEERPPVVSFHFNIPPAEHMQALKAAGCVILGSATTVAEGQALEAAGFDAIVAQGQEAGGHRGTWMSAVEDAMVGTLALVPQMVDRVHIPVVAAGGVMDGRGLVASLALGAAGVQMGTAFLTCTESGAHPAHKQALLEVTEDGTAITWAYSGRGARAVRNRFVTEMAPHRDNFLPFPDQRSMVADVTQAAAKQSRTDLMQMWTGQGTRLLRRGTAAELVAAVMREAEETLRRLRG